MVIVLLHTGLSDLDGVCYPWLDHIWCWIWTTHSQVKHCKAHFLVHLFPCINAVFSSLVQFQQQWCRCQPPAQRFLPILVFSNWSCFSLHCPSSPSLRQSRPDTVPCILTLVTVPILMGSKCTWRESLVFTLSHTFQLSVSWHNTFPDHLFHGPILHWCRRCPLHEWTVHFLCCGNADRHFGGLWDW